MINVTQTINKLDGEPLMQETRCPKCIEVYQSIYNLLSDSARAEMDAQQDEMVKIVSAEPEPMTLRLVINRALMTPLEDDKLTPESGVTRLLLATRVHENDEVELDSKEVTLIKERVAKVYSNSALIVGRACLLVDPAMNK